MTTTTTGTFQTVATLTDGTIEFTIERHESRPKPVGRSPRANYLASQKRPVVKFTVRQRRGCFGGEFEAFSEALQFVTDRLAI